MATLYNLTLAESKKKAPAGITKVFAVLVEKLPDPDYFFGDSTWSGGRSAWNFKVSEINLNKIKENGGGDVKIISGKATYEQTIGNTKLKFTASSKKSSKAADAKTTAMQERASAWIMRRSLKDNYVYGSWTDIKLDPKYKELEKIYPGCEEEWLKVFYAQQAKMLQEFSDSKFDEFNRDGGFMDYVTNLVKTKFGVSKKDTWDPADIWCIKNEKSITTLIDKTVDGNGSQTIQELNAVLRKLFIQRKVVGISLKKVSGNVARYEETNVSEDGLNSDYNYSVDKIKLDLSINSNKFNTQDTTVVVEGNNVEYKFQIKGNDSTKISNLKFEPTQKGATSARVGKAPVDMVDQLIKDRNLTFKNSHVGYPKTTAEFTKKQDEYIEIFKKIKSKGVETVCQTEQDFIQNMNLGFMKESHVALSKCMQMKFLDSILSLNQDDLNEFMTDMVFISAKRGKRFGPFGKLY